VQDDSSGLPGDVWTPGVEEATGPIARLAQWWDRRLRSVETAAAVADLEDRLSRWRRERKLGKGTLRATHVVAYRGFAADGLAHVRLRVSEHPPAAEREDDRPRMALFKTNVRRFVALPLAGVRTEVVLGGSRIDVVTDRRGYATAALPCDGLLPGWHEYRATTSPDDPDEAAASAVGQVQVPDPAATLAVVSDIDDTVLRTGLTEGFVAVQRTLLGDAHTRRPVPGMAALYLALLRPQDGSPAPAFWYLSTGPWVLYDVLADFLDVNGFPAGPLFLTDWGPNRRYLMRSGREHKRAWLRRLFAASAQTSFVLVGDSGQGDADVYLEAARAHRGRVAAIVVLDVGAHHRVRAIELGSWEDGLLDEGVPFYFVADAAEAAQVLASLGLVPPGTVDEVRAAAAREA
jgi:phosphatidate phosphatase APP1